MLPLGGTIAGGKSSRQITIIKVIFTLYAYIDDFGIKTFSIVSLVIFYFIRKLSDHNFNRKTEINICVYVCKARNCLG